MEVVSKITLTLDLSFKLHIFNTNGASVAKIGWIFTHRGVQLHIFNTNGASVAKTGWIFTHGGVKLHIYNTIQTVLQWQTLADTHTQGWKSCTISTAAPLASLSVKLIAPYTKALDP